MDCFFNLGGESEFADRIEYVIYCPNGDNCESERDAINEYSGSIHLSDCPRQIRTQAKVKGRRDEARFLLWRGKWHWRYGEGSEPGYESLR